MIIDFHAHTFPERLASRALSKLSQSSDSVYYLDGTLSAMQESMRANGIDRTVLLPVATSPSQCQTISRTAIEINNRCEETGIYSFGGIHPDNENYQELLCCLSHNGIKGIKLHPVFQGVYLDDIRYLRIIDCACEYGMIVVTHAGYDISFPGQAQATPEHILPVIHQLHPDKLVLAHMGGWKCWEQVEELLAGREVYFDSSFCLTPIRHLDQSVSQPMNSRQFRRLLKKHGADRILFGSDSPWGSQGEAVKLLQHCGLTQQELELIFAKNALALLQADRL